MRDSIQLCKKAGIRVFMVTGDNLATAESIARDVGIFEPDEDISQKSFLGWLLFSSISNAQRGSS